MICGLMIQHEAFCSFGENLKIFSETSHTRREIWSFPIYVHEVIYEVWKIWVWNWNQDSPFATLLVKEYWQNEIS